MLKDHKNVRENILTLSKLFPVVTDNYNLLLYHYWVIFDGATTIDAIGKATPAESITRNFRKLVEIGLITPTKETLEKRAEAEKEYRNDFAKLV
jgi:hypothetical protein